MFAINNFFICPQAHPGERHRVLNLYQDMSSRHLQDMSSRRLQDQQMFAGQEGITTDGVITKLNFAPDADWLRSGS